MNYLFFICGICIQLLDYQGVILLGSLGNKDAFLIFFKAQ